MPTPTAKSKYQLITYVSTREAARLSGAAEHALAEAVCKKLISGINLLRGEVFVRWEDCSATFLGSAMTRDADGTPSAEPAREA